MIQNSIARAFFFYIFWQGSSHAPGNKGFLGRCPYSLVLKIFLPLILEVMAFVEVEKSSLEEFHGEFIYRILDLRDCFDNDINNFTFNLSDFHDIVV